MDRSNLLLMLLLLEEEEDDDLMMLHYYLHKKNSWTPRRPASIKVVKPPEHRILKPPEHKVVKRIGQQVAKPSEYKIALGGYLLDNDTKFRRYFWLTRAQFQEVLKYVGQDLAEAPINSVGTRMKPEKKLGMALRYLVMSESVQSLAVTFRTSHRVVKICLEQVFQSIHTKMRPVYITKPTISTWVLNANKFMSRWKIPNVAGVISGKHIRVSCNNQTSQSSNEKNYVSVLLLAVMDADCKFVDIDVESYGEENDRGIFTKTRIGKSIQAGTVNFPPPEKLPNSEAVLPYFFVGDNAFPLSTYIIKQYSQKAANWDELKNTFNEKLAAVQKTTEIGFEMMYQVFQIFHRPLEVSSYLAKMIISNACILHNLIRNHDLISCNSVDELESDLSCKLPSENLIPLLSSHCTRAKNEAERMRDTIKIYLNNPKDAKS